MKTKRKLTVLIVAVGIAVMAAGCARKEMGPIGSKSNPIKMAFVPSLETGHMVTSADKLARAIEKKTGYSIKVSIPVSYAAVIEAMGAGRADIAWYAPLSYALAHKTVGAEVMLVTERDGQTNYFGIILARKGSSIKKIEDLRGKRFAFVDPLSTSGTLYAKELLLEHGIDPDKDIQAVYAGGHDKAIIALDSKQVDACSVYSGYGTDARDRVAKDIPGIKQKTIIIGRTATIPNDNVSASKTLPPEVRDSVRKALLEISGSPDGRAMLMEVAEINGLKPAKDSDYDTVRKMSTRLGLNLEEAVKKDVPKKKK